MKDISEAKRVALGGILAAVAITIMCLCGLIPIATYATAVICTLILQIVLVICGSKIAWAWYMVVALLGLLLTADKESVCVFIFLGYYPIIKPWLDQQKLNWLIKCVYFSLSICVLYWILLNIMGMGELREELFVFGKLGLAIMVLMGNAIFFLLDRLLNNNIFRRR